jgi:hypothetical protein
MNDFKFLPLTPKRILVGMLLLIAFVFLYSTFSAVLSNSQGTSSQSGMYGMVSGGGEFAPATPSSVKTFGRMSASMDSAEMYDNSGISLESGADMMMPQPPVPSQTPPSGSAKIIKSADLALLVRNIDESAAQVTQLRIRFNGEPGNASFNEYMPGVKTADVTIWVPSAHFDEALGEVKKLALRVERENIEVSDVSAHYVDLTARLKNLHSAEAQYVEIMKRAGKISDVLEVTRELNNTRAQIESIQGQLDHLSRQVALSAIHMSLKEEASPASAGSGWRPLTVLKSAAKDTLNDLTDFVDTLIVFIVKLPALLLNVASWVFVLWLLWKIGLVVCRHLYRIFSSALHKEKV